MTLKPRNRTYKRRKRTRNYRSKRYIQFRRKVYERDKACQFPGCKSRSKKFEVHHILRWADHPSLRFVVSNGILLHRSCHKKVTNNEHIYAKVFIDIIRLKNDNGKC